MIPFPSSAFASKQTITSRKLFAVSFTLDPNLASGTYYLCVIANGLLATPGTEPTNSTDLTATSRMLLFCMPVVHASGSAETFGINAADYGYASEAGWRAHWTDDLIARQGFMFVVSSTAPTSYTSAGAHLWTNATAE